MARDTLGDRLKIFAKQQFGSLKKLGEAIGMGSSQLSSYTTGEKKPDSGQLERFAAAGLNVHWLLTGEGDMNAPKGDGSAPDPTQGRRELGKVTEADRQALLEITRKLLEMSGLSDAGGENDSDVGRTERK